jgi:Ca2+/Na+ antiporter
MSSIHQLSQRIKYTRNWSFTLAIICTVGYLSLGKIVYLYWLIVFFTVIGIVTYGLNSTLEQELKVRIADVDNEEYPLKKQELINGVLSITREQIEPILNIINDINPPIYETILLKESLIYLLNDLKALKERTTAYLIVTEWLENTERRISLAKKASDIALKKHPLSKFAFPNAKKKRRHQLYQNVYDCLTWIKHSFAAGGYLTTNKLKLRIAYQKQVVTALELFITEKDSFLKDLPETIIPEIEIYFKKLIEEISA